MEMDPVNKSAIWSVVLAVLGVTCGLIAFRVGSQAALQSNFLLWTIHAVMTTCYISSIANLGRSLLRKTGSQQDSEVEKEHPIIVVAVAVIGYSIAFVSTLATIGAPDIFQGPWSILGVILALCNALAGIFTGILSALVSLLILSQRGFNIVASYMAAGTAGIAIAVGCYSLQYFVAFPIATGQ